MIENEGQEAKKEEEQEGEGEEEVEKKKEEEEKKTEAKVVAIEEVGCHYTRGGDQNACPAVQGIRGRLASGKKRRRRALSAAGKAGRLPDKHAYRQARWLAKKVLRRIGGTADCQEASQFEERKHIKRGYR